MAIRFFSKSDPRREFSNFTPFGIDLDTYWGGGRKGTGLDKLGRIVARIREELRAVD
jgi:predicted NAD-dependent protein-ADP-ribosyltransferase YbiA (DUF1768 family)